MTTKTNVLEVGFKLLSDNAKLPTKAYPNDSGFDIYAAESRIIEPGHTAVIKTDLAIILPEGYDAYIKNRSGVSSKTKLRVVSPPIDEGYRGAIGIIIDNISTSGNEFRKLRDIKGDLLNEPYPSSRVSTSYLIQKGDKIAQLVVQPRPNTVAVEITGDLDETARGTNGYGSSGY